ncbi:hypothetical protein HBH56_042280 [Parastagonospora nodorum]|uniref:C3H1-type domain-containing protein n=2 Tax=Phaeosphaeria nodorum (strain SN15 / ATCC MYA-4574 / FGSC 10173) TaxID=321614 RepID=A0A7U2EW17_PHANO|nr:hypothetical protein SNOG_08013 [Parastagonospora nodorum SN15]KAH3917580.1 hypothetical protein HBH56_042280 [Parastagonospora nodorum]EAT84289.1 hypothetical protein SNOG_08013 [Parastagonospora nodorum SN15]KAH3933203.1 hypothetical protein HBH54_070030 [Parastagonospora nodorum]KAH4139674.1 hypothetical protein HBH45_093630 [Parastagonospora nodorum]KAH4168664.1 hypothetical protein HBH44_042970 [Parastagonospora nodorum]
MTSTRAEMAQRLLEYLDAQVPTQLPTKPLEKAFENMRRAEAVPVAALHSINEADMRHLCAYIKANLLQEADRSRNIVDSKAIPAKPTATLPLPSVKQWPLHPVTSASSAPTLPPAPSTKPIAPAPVQQSRFSKPTAPVFHLAKPMKVAPMLQPRPSYTKNNWTGTSPAVDRDTRDAPGRRHVLGTVPRFTSQLPRATCWPSALRTTKIYKPFLSYAKGDNGEVEPWRYGSNNLNSLGLCFTTFATKASCPHGGQCDWRHRALSEEELQWLRDIGKGLYSKHLVGYQTFGVDVVEDTQWPH